MIIRNFLLLAVALSLDPARAANSCAVTSGSRTAALVELYTSEGCSSCPPADRALSALQGAAGADALFVPLAMHVTYWDQLGWRDPFGQAMFDMRQRAQLERQQLRTAYTPQFFVGGHELRSWTAGLADAIKHVNAQPATVKLTLTAQPAAQGVALDVSASAVDRRTAGMLYVAVSESGLDSQVKRGENGGATLHHDAATRLLVGPVPLVDGSARLQRTLALPAGWKRERLQAVAFVQDGEGAAILQAVSTAMCAGARGL